MMTQPFHNSPVPVFLPEFLAKWAAGDTEKENNSLGDEDKITTEPGMKDKACEVSEKHQRMRNKMKNRHVIIRNKLRSLMSFLWMKTTSLLNMLAVNTISKHVKHNKAINLKNVKREAQSFKKYLDPDADSDQAQPPLKIQICL